MPFARFKHKMHQKKFVTNIAFLIVLNLLIKPFWPLGIEPAVQNAVGNAGYGEYFILFNFWFDLTKKRNEFECLGQKTP